MTPTDTGTGTDAVSTDTATPGADATTDTAPPVDAGPTAASACMASATASCARLAACSMTDLTVRYGDMTTCVTRQSGNCVTALAAPGTGNSPAHTMECAAAYAGWACGDFLGGLGVPAACAQQTGAGATGSACAFNGQCSSGFCALGRNAACGTCQSAPAVGAACDAIPCSGGLYCAGNNLCATPVAVGGACDTARPCSVGLSCVTPTGATAGTCQTQGTMDMPCDINRRTAPACNASAGFACNTTTRLCAPLTVGGTAAACGVLPMGAFGVCSAAGFCARVTGSTTGACLAAAADGAPCDTTNGPDCTLPARCVYASPTVTAGTCRLLDAAMCH